ncbi:MAG: sugar ABC transporter permease [Clostridia bacterium]|nr:sugar ABC transporter permease [Clostridia bacterium]
MIKNNTNGKQKKYDKGFYALIMLFPTIQFLIFYLYVHVDSFLLPFQSYDLAGGTMSWTGSNISQALEILFSQNILHGFGLNLMSYGISVCISMPLSLLFSFYIYKKNFGSKFFRIILYLPSIISSLVFVIIYQNFVERALPSLVMSITGEQIQGLIENMETRIPTIIVFGIFMSFGSNVILYTNAMLGISDEMVDAAKLDGAVGFKEFIYVTMPTIWRTFSVFFINGLMMIFSSDLNAYAFFGQLAPENVQTYGYYIFVQTKKAVNIGDYPVLAAMSLMISLVVIPLVLFVRWALKKYGPSEE